MTLSTSTYFSYFFNMWLLIILTVIGYAVLLALPQADQVFIDIGQNAVSVHVLTSTGFAVLFWSLTMWFGSRLVGRAWLADQSERSAIVNSKTFCFIIVQFPRLLGLLILSFFLASVYEYSENNQRINVYLSMLLMAIYLVIVLGRRYVFKNIPSATSWQNTSWRWLPRHQKIVLILTCGFYLVCLVLFSVPHTSILLSQFIGPIAVLSLGLAFFSAFAAGFQYMDILVKVPITFLFIIYLMLIGLWNNNDDITRLEAQTLSEFKEKDIRTYFNHWYQSRRSKLSVSDTLDIYLVAGQGGGSRAAYWTSTVLSQLDSLNDTFFPSVFAFSTVSGSSVGTGFYCAYKRLELDADGIDLNKNRKSNLREIAGRDFLSPNTAPMFYQELIQSIIPFGMPWTDRSKYLEEAWSEAFSDQMGSTLFDEHFMNLYDSGYQMPLQFYNTMVVERGMQAIIAPFMPNRVNTYNQIHLVNEYETKIPLKTAVSLSARFPVFTAPGKFIFNDSTDLNLADGGYFENTGISISLLIYKVLNELRAENSLKFNVKILYIQNSKGDYFQNDTEINAFKLLSIPVVALYNCWNTEAAQMYDFAQESVDNSDFEDEFKIKKLDYKYRTGSENKNSLDFPLSRYLSRDAKSRMDKQVDEMLF